MNKYSIEKMKLILLFGLLTLVNAVQYCKCTIRMDGKPYCGKLPLPPTTLKFKHYIDCNQHTDSFLCPCEIKGKNDLSQCGCFIGHVEIHERIVYVDRIVPVDKIIYVDKIVYVNNTINNCTTSVSSVIQEVKTAIDTYTTGCRLHNWCNAFPPITTIADKYNYEPIAQLVVEYGNNIDFNIISQSCVVGVCNKHMYDLNGINVVSGVNNFDHYFIANYYAPTLQRLDIMGVRYIFMFVLASAVVKIPIYVNKTEYIMLDCNTTDINSTDDLNYTSDNTEIESPDNSSHGFSYIWIVVMAIGSIFFGLAVGYLYSIIAECKRSRTAQHVPLNEL